MDTPIYWQTVYALNIDPVLSSAIRYSRLIEIIKSAFTSVLGVELSVRIEHGPRRDPEEVALELLQQELDARHTP